MLYLTYVFVDVYESKEYICGILEKELKICNTLHMNGMNWCNVGH